MALFFVIPVALLIFFGFESAWWALALGGVVALPSVLGMALWAQGGFEGIYLRGLRLFLRAEAWGLGSKVNSRPMDTRERLAVAGVTLATLALFLVWLLVDR
jgi:hypothetical protein